VRKDDMSRALTSIDYLRALSNEAEQYEFAALVVGFERETRFIWNGVPDAACRLDTLLIEGGKPMAVLGASIVGNAVVYRLDPFPPYDGDESVRRYLASVGDNVMETFKQRWQNARN
jgi:hypothetical protein